MITYLQLVLTLTLTYPTLTLRGFFFFFWSQIENKAENIWPISHMRGGSNDLRLPNNYSWSGMINMLSHPIAIFSSWFYFFRKKKLNSFTGKREKKTLVLGIAFLFGNTFLKTPKPPSQLSPLFILLYRATAKISSNPSTYYLLCYSFLATTRIFSYNDKLIMLNNWDLVQFLENSNEYFRYVRIRLNPSHWLFKVSHIIKDEKEKL